MITKKTLQKFLPQSALAVVLFGLFLGFMALRQPSPLKAPKIIKSSVTSNSLFFASNREYSVKFGERNTNKPVIEYSLPEGNKISFSYRDIDGKLVSPIQKDETVTFPDVAPNIDLLYTTLPDGLKEEIIIKNQVQGHIFNFNLNTTEAYPQSQTDALFSPTFFDKNGKYLFHFEKPFAIDANGARTDNVTFQIKKDTKTDSYFMTLDVDRAWLESPDRKYPISIDPTIIHDTTSEFSTGQFNRVADVGTGFITGATGGAITYKDGYTIHTFTSGTTTFTPTVAGNVEVLVVGGGGGGGDGVDFANNGGGGGAGGLIYQSSHSVSTSGYSVVVGNGGARNTNGQNSTFDNLTAVGGGKGATNNAAAGNGGSGGGACPAQTNKGTGTSSQGFDGGVGESISPFHAGGGGGFSEVGNTDGFGYGGDGTAYSISGNSVIYAGGGSGGNDAARLAGGDGGGGTGAVYSDASGGGNGTANTGGGGGGGASRVASLVGGTGGSGIVIIRYPTGPALGSNYQELSADPYTVGLWHMNETSGNVLDSSGNGNTGTATGTTVVSGILGNARNFNGSSDYIRSNASGTVTGNFTVEMWVNPIANTGSPELLSTRNGADSSFDIQLSTTGLHGDIGNGTAWLTTAADAIVNIPLNSWTHVAYVVTNTDWTVYVNGVWINGGTYASNTPLLFDSTRNIFIGSFNGTNNFLNGSIDEVRISNIARSAEEIRLDASRRPYSTYTSDVLDLAKVYTWNPLKWLANGLATGDGETATVSAQSARIAQWNFNNTFGTTATSNAGSCGLGTCDGTLINFLNTSGRDISPPRATGGAITYSGGYTIHTFTSTGTFTPSQSMNVETLVVAGGGGGANTGSGGGAGGYRYQTGVAVNAQAYTITVGLGGTSPADGSPGNGQKGVNSVFSTITAEGGGGGITHGGGNGMAGGSGSGGTITTAGGTPTGGTASAGNAGGAGYVDAGWVGTAGGGGGAGGVGGAGGNSAGVGNGGAGTTNSISGASVTYAAGGGGGEVAGINVGTGGSGIGGGGTVNSDGTAGAVNTGSGGGGGSYLTGGPVYYHTGGTGGSGIVIIRYPSNPSGWTAINRRWGSGALMFDGVDDYVTMGNQSSLNFTNSFSFSAWIKTSSIPDTSTYSGIMGKGYLDSAVNGYGMYLDGPLYGKISCQFRNDATIVGVSSNPISDGNWHHVVCVRDHTANSSKIYVDGILKNENSGVLSLGYTNTKNFAIGQVDRTTWGFPFQGIIDSATVYSRALTASEILSNFNSSRIELQTRVGNSSDSNDGTWEAWKPTTSETAITSLDSDSANWSWDNTATYMPKSKSDSTVIKQEGTSSLKLESGIGQTDANTVGLWHLDETGGTGAYLKDVSGSANHGTPTGTTVTNGITNKARSFNGSSDLISIPNSTNYNFGSSNFSISTWVYFTSVSKGYQIIFDRRGAVDQTGYILYLETNNTLNFITSSAGSWDNLVLQTGIIPSLNNWSHIVVTRSGNTFTLYLNGVPIKSGTYSGSIGAQTGDPAIGNKRLGTLPGSGVQGLIDEVRIDNIARSPEEIAESYRAGRDHYLNRTISNTNLSTGTNLPFYVASDRLGTFSQFIIGESPFANYQPDANTVGLWHLDDNTPFFATGGTVTYSGGYTIHTFTGSSTFTPTGAGVVEILVVAGGGGGGQGWPYQSVGGGGGGGVVYNSSSAVTPQAYTVTVGGGGTGGDAGTASTSGQDSIFNGMTALGGGAGGMGNGANGGSGGGSGTQPSNTGGTATQGGSGGGTGYGNNGGSSASCNAGGGGGAGGAGASCNSGNSGNGGDGRAFSISGSSVYYAAGGGGGHNEAAGTAGTGGNGGGGNGGKTNNGANATGYGSGGGGAGANAATGYKSGNGSSGIVIIRYPTSETTVKDSSGNGYNGGATSPSLVQGKIGKARSFNGTSDYINTSVVIEAATSSNLQTFEGWVYNNGVSGWGIFGSNADSTGEFHLHVQGNNTSVTFRGSYYGGFAGDGQNTVSVGVNVGWHYIAVVKTAAKTFDVYLDGTRIIANANKEATVPSNFLLGQIWSTSFYSGIIDEVRISNVARTADEIRQAYEIGARTHNITFDFKASLGSGNLIANSSDLGFTVDETAHGSSLAASHLFLGDKIIIKENYDGTEYLAQGVVNSVNSSTGAVTVASWDTGSTFPASGFTANATVFKWQREYFDITSSLSTQRDATTYLTYRITDGSQGANIWIDDIKSNTGYLNTPTGSTITSSIGNRYFQYRAILTQNDLSAPSAALTSLTLDYIPNEAPNIPTLDSPTNTSISAPLLAVLKTTATDNNGDSLKYKINLCTNAAMTTGCKVFDQTTSTTGWSAASYASGAQATYTIQSADILAQNTVYYWKSLAIDPTGINVWGSTQASPYSFTTNRNPNTPTLLTPTNTATNQPVIQTFTTSDTDVDADILKYKIIVCKNLLMTIDCLTFDQTTSAIGWSAASYASGVTASYTLQTAILPNVTYYWRSYSIDELGSNTWSATQATPFSYTTSQVPAIVTLLTPTDTLTDATLIPTFTFSTTDSNGDYLRYRFKICTDISMVQGCEIYDQTLDQTGFSGQNAQSNSAYSSGTTATFTHTASLIQNQTYFWQAFAIDQAGSNSWSSPPTTFSFTTMSSSNKPAPCTTTKALDNSSITVNWTDTSNEEYFQVWKVIDNGLPSQLGSNLNPNTIQLVDSAVSNSHSYAYLIRGLRYDGSNTLYSDWCPTASVYLSIGSFKFDGLKIQGVKIN